MPKRKRIATQSSANSNDMKSVTVIPKMNIPKQNQSKQKKKKVPTVQQVQEGEEKKATKRNRQKLKKTAKNMQLMKNFHHINDEKSLSSEFHQILSKMTPPTQLELNDITEHLLSIWRNGQMDEKNFEKRMKIFTLLSGIIEHTFPAGALYITGSSLNGMGYNESDLDLVFVPTQKQLSMTEQNFLLFNCVRRMLRDLGEFNRIISIRARVPILKFQHKNLIEGDINLNHINSIYNTILIRLYGLCDERFIQLAFLVKKWARKHNINDGSKHTIASYSLYMMVIHYLQYRLPQPILPCLHKIIPDCCSMKIPLNDLTMKSILPPIPKSPNTSDISSLFIGFLKYYALEFEYSTNVISVRTGGVLPKSQFVNSTNSLDKRNWKEWKFLCIEDPIDGNNTSRSVSQVEEFLQIISVFRRSFFSIIEHKNLDEIF
ncbi:hypothetical protein SNEBB_006849 [Seison nebaliae]|nr:hypothetical protein SNEBB_006849 [Seison nebaliae]